MAYTAAILTRVVVLFAMLLALTRLTGRRQISQSTFFDFLVATVVGNIAAGKLGDPHVPLLPWAGAILLWFGLILAVDLVAMRDRRFARLTRGTPSLLIDRGRIAEQQLRRNRLGVEELMANLRQKGILNPADVEYALLEADGRVSVQPKGSARSLTTGDLDLSTAAPGIPRPLVVEGRIETENLRAMGLTVAWLRLALARAGYPTPDAVFYASLDANGRLYVDGYDRPESNLKRPVPNRTVEPAGARSEYGPH